MWNLKKYAKIMYQITCAKSYADRLIMYQITCTKNYAG